MYQEEITAEFQRIGSAIHQFRNGAAVIPPGEGGGFAGRTSGKVGGIGDAHIEAAGGKETGQTPQVRAYAFHTAGEIVAADVFHGFLVSTFRQFQRQESSLLQSSRPRVPQPEPRSSTRAFLGSRAKWARHMESVLKGKAPSHKDRVYPLGKYSISTSAAEIAESLYNKKLACARAQANYGLIINN